MITKVNVRVLAADQNGNPLSGAQITIRLNQADTDPSGGYIVPEEVVVTADNTGVANVALWPNALGTTGSHYYFEIMNPDTGDTFVVEAAIPNHDCDLHSVAALPPSPDAIVATPVTMLSSGAGAAAMRRVQVRILFTDQAGNPVANGAVTAILNRVEVDPAVGFIIPETIESTTDSEGKCTLLMWPNALGSTASRYQFVLTNPDTGDDLGVVATIPDANCDLHLVADLPAYPGKTDGQLAVEEAVAAAAAALDAMHQVQVNHDATESMLLQAQTARDAAAVSATLASQQATAAGQQADNAAASEDASSISAAQAAGSASTAQDWATKTDAKVGGIDWSAKWYAAAAAASLAAMVMPDWSVADPASKAYIANKPTKLSQFSNDTAFITAAASITGNAATATKLATARTINGVAFDGSGNIIINAVDATAREPAIAAGTAAQYWRGDKSWQTLNTGAVPETTNLYFTNARVLATPLAGLTVATNADVVATDTVLVGIGKLQAGLTAHTTALAGKEPTIAVGTAAQFWKGNKTWAALTSGDVTTALNFTPYNATNPAGYITAAASITGNAATATKLATARNINGVAFDGTADITVADNTKLAAANKLIGWGNYAVATATYVPINLPLGGAALQAGYAYRVTLTTIATSSPTGAVYHVYQTGATTFNLLASANNGTTSNNPQLRINVAGTGLEVFHNHASTYTIQAVVEMYNTGNVTVAYPTVFGLEGAFSAANFKLDNTTGCFGMGIASPITRLHINSLASGNGLRIDAPAATGTNYISFYGNNAVRQGYVGMGSGSTDDMFLVADRAGTNVIFQTAGTEKMRLDSSGNLMVGTTTNILSARFTVVTSGAGGAAGLASAIVKNQNTNGASNWAAVDDTGTKYGEIGVLNSATTNDATYGAAGEAYVRASASTAGLTLSSANSTSGYIRFLTGAGSERARVDKDGNVAIGITTAAAKLHVSSDIRSDGLFYSVVSGNTTGVGSDSIGTYLYSSANIMRFIGSGARERMRVDSAGKLGIGTTTPATLLEVAGDITAKKLHMGFEHRNVLSFYSTAAVVNTVKIKTNISWTGSGQYSVHIHGYHYRIGARVDLTVNFYAYTTGGGPINYTASSAGGWNPSISLSNDAGLLSICLGIDDGDCYFLQASVDVVSQNGTVTDMTGWTFADEAPAAGALPVSYLNKQTTLYSATYLGLGSNNAEQARFDASGNFAIGSTTPISKFHVAGNTPVASFVTTASAVGADIAALKFFSDGTNTSRWAGIKGIVPAGASGIDYTALAFYTNNGTTNNAERMRIDASGNVGVTPSAAIGAGNGFAGNAGTAFGSIVLYDNATGFTKLTNTYASGGFTFSTNGFERLRIDASGNLGINMTSPQARLSLGGGTGKKLLTYDAGVNGIQSGLGTDMAGSSYELTLFAGSPDGLNGRIGFGRLNTTAGVYTQYMLLDTAGNLGVNTAAPKSRIHAVGDLTLQNTTLGAGNKIAGLYFMGYTGYASPLTAGIESWIPTGSAGVDFQDLRFFTVAGNNILERMRIDPQGNIGLWGAAKGNQASFGMLELYASALMTSITNGGLYIGKNWYYSSSAYKNKLANVNSLQYSQDGAGHHWLAAAAQAAADTVITFSEQMRLDVNGNLGLGATPSAWGASYRALDYTTGCALYGSGVMCALASNTYFDGTNWLYKTTTSAGRYDVNGNTHRWYAVASGTAGAIAAFTQTMTLDGTGNLGLGVAPSAWTSYGSRVFELPDSGTIMAAGGTINIGANWYYNGTSNVYKIAAAASYTQQTSGIFKWFNAPAGTVGAAITFTQAMTLDLTGNLTVGGTVVYGGGNYPGVGSTSASPFIFYVNAAEKARIDSSGRIGINTSLPDQRLTIASGSDTTNSNDGISFYGSSANKQAAILSYNNGAYNGDLRFYTKASASASTTVTEGMRLDQNGKLTVFGGKLNLTAFNTPATSGAVGTAGDIQIDANYVYVCTAANTWKRVALTAF